VEGEERTLLGGPWRLTSYVTSPDGRPLHASRDPRFWTTYDEAWLEGFGRPRLRQAERFDLLFEHESGRAVIWARTVPIRRALQFEPEHRLVMASIQGIDGGSGSWPDLLGLPTSEFVALVGEPDVRPAIVDSRRTNAYTFDVLLGPDRERARAWRATVVALRSPRYVWRAGRSRLPTLIVLGYAAHRDEHDAHLAAFESLVRRVDLAPP
ncbi:MAG TPA: hypothetical protein VIL20_03950, partial [Sandaracinaceae bacterium]